MLTIQLLLNYSSNFLTVLHIVHDYNNGDTHRNIKILKLQNLSENEKKRKKRTGIFYVLNKTIVTAENKTHSKA